MEINWDNVKVKYVSGLYKIDPEYPTLEDFEWKLTFYLVNKKKNFKFSLKEVSKQFGFSEELCTEYCKQLGENGVIDKDKLNKFIGNNLIKK